MRYILVFVCTAFLLSSCGGNTPIVDTSDKNLTPSTPIVEQGSGNTTQTGTTELPPSTPAVESGSLEHQEPLANTGTGSNEYTFFFKDTNEEKVTLHHKAGQATNIYFINSEAKKMKVQVKSIQSGGNIRLSQIIAPDGAADGPFGQEVEYNLTQFGGYQLIFNENMMAGDPWTGDVEIKVTLTK